MVVRRARALPTHEPEIILGHSVTLLGCLSEPPPGLDRVLRDTLAIVISRAEIVLGLGEPLFGCLSVPPYGLGVVSRHAGARAVAPSEKVLGGSVSSLCQWAEESECGRVITLLPGRHPIFKRPCLRDTQYGQEQ